jgi:hypothetical protein
MTIGYHSPVTKTSSRYNRSTEEEGIKLCLICGESREVLQQSGHFHIFFFVALGLELRAYTLNHSSSPFS